MVVTECIGRNETSDNVDVFLRNLLSCKSITELDAIDFLQDLIADSASFVNGEILAPLAYAITIT